MSHRPLSPRSLLWILVVVIAALWIGRKPWQPSPSTATLPSAPASKPSAAKPAVAADPAGGQPGAAAAAPAGGLFRFVQVAHAAALDAALPAPTQRIHYVEIDRALVQGKRSPFWERGGRIVVPLAEGGSLAVVVNDSVMTGPDRFTSSGQIEGRPASRALFAWNEGFLHASIEDPVLGSFVLRAATAELAQFYRIDPALVAPCGGERRPRREALAPRRSAAVAPVAGDAAARALAAPDNPQRAEVHVMMLYTPAVLSTMTGASRVAALQSAFDLALAKVNAAFDASLITARVKLVRIAETVYDETLSAPNQVQDDALTALYQGNDARMDEIHAWRDEAGADIVCLALNRRDSVSSGLSFLLDAPHDPSNERFAFSIVEYAAIGGTNVVAHELGHIFGCAHDRNNATSEGAYAYSYGYRFAGADGRQYRDIMAYPPGTELAYFSNPEVVVPAPVNAAIGIAEGHPGESNTALTIERTAFSTAEYRLQTQTPASAGTLINVATRAYVGTGNEVLIGGFVVAGPEPKRMLVRGAGPALRVFGVGGVLEDPVLRIFSQGNFVQENDSWSDAANPGAAGIATAIQQVGAFPFDVGSADAALLITLPAGAYTAVMEGVGAKTGNGLIEAYEVERTAVKIINLATRGYVGRDGREMIGGFVVNGTPGETKRLLLRVLGPTLARPPFNMTGTLDDPELELRNAAGSLLLKSDDWTLTSEGGVSLENDFRPLVQQYSEKQIFATGYAPTNRREPCVLVDLPPGNYTAIVRPYEFRSSDPSLDQPARPGVGVVEVYEISR